MKKKENSAQLTRYGTEAADQSKVSWPEYPRPQLVRDNWQNLNGVWDLKIRDKDGFVQYQGDIQVPFSPESILSGVYVQSEPDDLLVYSRSVSIQPPDHQEQRLILHFEAVDQNARLYVNGKYITSHEGGYWPLDADITQYLSPDGRNEIALFVQDPVGRSLQARGKQSEEVRTIWYPNQAGIWQSVWCEWVDQEGIKEVFLIPDVDHHQLQVKVEFFDGKDHPVQVSFKEDGKSHIFPGGNFILDAADVSLWSPEHPVLYPLYLKSGSDQVKTYFAMRKIEVRDDHAGIRRIFLNGKPIYQSGLLDQGYWSDGLLTPPSDQAIIDEMKAVKDLGFNVIRKHIKVEPRRWYYHADRLGLLVWQDFVSGGGAYNKLAIQVAPYFDWHLPDTVAGLGNEDRNYRKIFCRDALRTIRHLYNHPSIICWGVFNEGWGQFETNRMSDWVKSLDPSRLVDGASGWHDQGGSDLKSDHVYYKKYHFKPDRYGRAHILSEFGGYSLPLQQVSTSMDTQPESEMTERKTSEPNVKSFGYKAFTDAQAWQNAIGRLYEQDVLPYISKGLNASIYTQLSDVEQEINGLFSYDRSVLKGNPDFWKEMNQRLGQEFDQAVSAHSAKNKRKPKGFMD